jgi:hypothetical protein
MRRFGDGESDDNEVAYETSDDEDQHAEMPDLVDEGGAVVTVSAPRIVAPGTTPYYVATTAQLEFLQFDDDGISYQLHGSYVFQSSQHLSRFLRRRRVHIDDVASSLSFPSDSSDDDDDDQERNTRRRYGVQAQTTEIHRSYMTRTEPSHHRSRGDGPLDSSDRFVVDTACTGHLFRSERGLMDVTSTDKVKVIGITKDAMKVEKVGHHACLGKVFIAPWAGANLLSVPQLMRTGCTIKGEGESMLIKDKDDRIIVRAHLDEKGLFSAAGDQIRAYLSSVPTDAKRVHYTKEETDRASAAWKLHKRLGHPSREVLSSALDHNVLQDVFLTSRDLSAAYTYTNPAMHA